MQRCLTVHPDILLAEAIQFHQAGDLAEAEKRYRWILAQEPRHADALQLLGVIAFQNRNPATAVELIQAAIGLSPNVPEYHNNLGQALERLDRINEAEQSYRIAIGLRRNFAEAHNNLGNVLRRKKDLDAAAEALRHAIQLLPDYADAHGNLANVLADQKNFPAALVAYETALRLAPQSARLWSNLGTALQKSGDLPKAVESFRQAARLAPNEPTVRNDLGAALRETGQFVESLQALKVALELMPGYADAYHELGLTLQQMRRPNDAAAAFREAIRLQPDHAQVYFSYGMLLKTAGQLREAIPAFEQAIRLKPDFMTARNALGLSLSDAARTADAIAVYEAAIQFDPNFAATYVNWAKALQWNGEIDRAIAACRTALEKDPSLGTAHLHLGNALLAAGRQADAIAEYRKAVALAPDRSSYHSNLLMTLHYLPDLSPAEIAAEHRVWAERHAEPLRARIPIHVNERNPERPLRIGYVSPDFRAHAVARFMLPILEQHDRTQFEIYCYSDVVNADTITRQFMNLTPNWRHIAGATDATVADVVQEDKIDILVDLAAHSSGNRMLVFARKPAPVQITYLAYPGSTGQRAIDYRLTDRYFDPAPPGGEIYTERSLFLPETYWCYQPAATPPVNPTPSLTSGSIAFGCLNNFSKVTQAILVLWAQILRRVPGATLLLHAYEGSHRTRLREWFAGEGVDPERIGFVGSQSLNDYLATYHRIDIALDPFPYVGGTTTCDSLWMGVPVVTLTGRTAISRGGASILNNVGLPDLIAATGEDYIRIAVALAEDGARRQRLRADLRGQLQASPLMDAPRFVRALEAAYRGAWREWCSGSPATEA